MRIWGKELRDEPITAAKEALACYIKFTHLTRKHPLLIGAMGLLYFFETTVEFRAVDPNNVFKRWLDILEAFTAYPAKTTGVEIKQFWKVSIASNVVI